MRMPGKILHLMPQELKLCSQHNFRKSEKLGELAAGAGFR
jgi:hypothetical protein